MNENLIDNLIQRISKLPSLGKRSAKRIALHLLNSGSRDEITMLSKALSNAAEEVKNCSTCGNISEYETCPICANEKRDSSVLCIVETVADLWAIEESASFSGKYLVLGGVLSAIDGITPDNLRINGLKSIMNKGQVTEVILATNATIEGETTAHYISDILEDYNINITRLAHGLPIGGELEYLDNSTIGFAFNARKAV